MNEPIATTLRAEEREEAERHDLLYRDPGDAALMMVPDDWERFNGMTEGVTHYQASMLRLGNVRGLRVLDAGCGDGWLTVILAKLGAVVDAFDISPEGVRTAQRRAELNGVADRCRLATGSCYEIPFEDARYDAVMGQSILHHLRHKDQAAAELFRVMKPGARAIFAEPFGNSLWLERLRLLVPVASEAPEDPTEWSRQFKYSDLEPFRSLFRVTVEEFQFLSRIDRVVPWPPLVRAVSRLDRHLLRTFPALRPYARSIIVEFQRPEA